MAKLLPHYLWVVVLHRLSEHRVLRLAAVGHHAAGAPCRGLRK